MQKTRVVLLLENKLCILNRPAMGEKATKPASEFGIGNSTVTDLLKESIIRSLLLTMEYLSVCLKEHKIMHLADNEKVDEAMVCSKEKPRNTDYRAYLE